MTEHNQAVLETFVKTFAGKNPPEEDVEDFGKRVFSFIEEQKWVKRPLILSPAVCAQYGWKCINSNLLECVTCCSKLCTQEPNIDVYDAYKACIEKIFTDLKDSHKTHCPWPLAPSPESFVRILPLPKEEALNQFGQRLKSCLQFECSIPQIKDTIPAQLGLTQQHSTSLCKLSEVDSEDVHLIGLSVVCIAATGWSLMSKKNGDLKTYIKCQSCQRLIWVKSFNLINTLGADDTSTGENGSFSEDVTENSESDLSNGSPRKKIKLEKIDFDPLEEHRPWCRWVIPTHQVTKLSSKSEIKAEDRETSTIGWKVYLKSLLRNVCDSQEADSENSPTKEQLRSVKNLLESWTDSTS